MSLELNLSSPRVTCDDWSQWGPVINKFVFCFQLRWNAGRLREILTTAVSFCQAVGISNRSKYKGAPKGSRCSTAQEVQEHTEEGAAPNGPTVWDVEDTQGSEA